MFGRGRGSWEAGLVVHPRRNGPARGRDVVANGVAGPEQKPTPDLHPPDLPLASWVPGAEAPRDPIGRRSRRPFPQTGRNPQGRARSGPILEMGRWRMIRRPRPPTTTL